MRGLCGWFSERAATDGDRNLTRMLDSAHPRVADALVVRAAGAALAAFGSVARPVVHEADDFVLVLAGHPRLRRGSERTAQPQLIAQALRTRGRAALAELGGDFALAAWDARSRRGLIAVDRIGVHQLVYRATSDGLVFGTTLDLLHGHEDVPRTLSPQGLYDYLYYHVSPGPATVFAGLERVPPGHCVEFDERGAQAPAAYWQMRFVEPQNVRYEDLKDEFMGLLRAAVGEASEGAQCGSFLSGGTDSSTVSGLLGKVGTAPAQTFSIGFDVDGYDETEYARIAARFYATDHHEYYIKPADVVDSLPRIAASYDQPFGNASAVPTFQCAQLAARHGVARLLAGDGGDELFGGNERYAKQHLLGLYGRVPGLLRRAAIEPALSLPGVGALPGLRKLRSYVEQARPDMPWRYESYNLLQHLGAERVLSRDFLAQVDMQHPRRLLHDAYAPYAGDSLVNQMLAIDQRFILADGDLPKVTHMCNLAGVDVSFPLLDDRIVEFSQRLPSDMKLRGTQLRWFFKKALSDFLPPEIITKKKHGFGLPVGPWLLNHKPLMDLAMDAIALLRPRGIVQPAFIDELVGVKLREQSAYYGTMVWLLMMLGLWLDSRKL